MSGITSTGLGSGVDVSAIVDGLVGAEGDVKNALLDAKEADTLAKITAYGQVRSSLEALHEQVKKMNTEAEVIQYSASVETNSSGNAMFDAITTTNAQPGTFEIQVTNLAKANRLSTADLNAATSTLGSGIITFTVNSQAFDVVIPSDTNSVEEVRDLINAETIDSGVFAAIVTVDSGTKLTLSSKETGTDYSITVTVDDDDGNDTNASGLSRLVNANMTVDQAAEDATLTLNGSTVTSQSNVLSTMIEGVIVTLKEVDLVDEYTLTISEDTESTKTLISDFVSVYNDFIDVVAEQTAYRSSEDSDEFSGVLIGDNTTRSIMLQIRRAMFYQDNNVSESVRVLSDIGVTTDPTNGKLIVNDETLDDALRDNYIQVGKVLTKNETGLINQVNSTLNIVIQTGGSVSNTLNALNSKITDIADQRLALTSSLDNLENRLLRQFNAMDRIVSSLRSTSEFLSTQISGFVKPFSFRNSG